MHRLGKARAVLNHRGSNAIERGLIQLQECARVGIRAPAIAGRRVHNAPPLAFITSAANKATHKGTIMERPVRIRMDSSYQSGGCSSTPTAVHSRHVARVPNDAFWCRRCGAFRTILFIYQRNTITGGY
ncbi:hypothetical protein EVAR_8403_1 [Eumeta japonica]|uniref:Uncharacterized protein n=1 Tax=Eumeta variegata TaxID=151549 RepID=A0A4C1WF94_EUMVA|nr:hypothetical protein EVAR_8403_1 [Eumeta japonica]